MRRVSNRSIVFFAFLATALSSVGGAREVPFFLVPQAVSTSPWGVAAGDVDQDGFLDLVFTDDVEDTVTWLDVGNGGNQTVHSIATGVDGATGVAAADFDGDGDPDVAVAARDVNDVLVWTNDGAGASWTGPSTVAASSNGVTDLAAGDLDGDGDVDLVGAVTGAGLVRRWLNDGGTWTPALVSTATPGLTDVELFDMDGDGDLDVVANAPDTDSIGWWANDGAGGGWSTRLITNMASHPGGLAVADLDQDGDPDVVAALTGTDETAWWENTAGDGSVWSAAQGIGPLSDAKAVAVADLDADGDLDVAATGPMFTTVLGWFEQTGPGVWSWRVLDDLSVRTPRKLLAVDLHDDGDADLVYTHVGNDAYVMAAEHRDHRRRPRFRVYAAQDAGVIRLTTSDWTLGDVDGDGRMDAVLNDLGIAPAPDSLQLLRGVPGGHPDVLAYTRDYIGLSDGRMDRIDLGDVDGDGHLDVLAASSFLGESVDVWENLGNATGWTAHTSINGGPSEPPFDELATGDFDGDGDLDVVGFLERLSPGVDRVLAWWEQVGDPFATSGWARHDLATATDASLLINEIRVADVTGDGRLDFVTAYDGTVGPVIVWENQGGTPLSFQRNDLPTPGTRQFELADADSDGDLDVLGLGAWWENDLRGTGTWIRNPVDANMNALSVFDLDGDGDPDVVGGACDDGEGGLTSPCWWRNEVESTLEGFFGTPLPLLTDGDWLLAADFDGDGDGDILGGPLSGFTGSWRNQGGHAALAATISAGEPGPGAVSPLLNLTLEHGGTLGDSAVEAATLVLFFEADGIPVDTATLGSLVSALELHRDDGNALRDGADTLILRETALTASSGFVELILPDGDPSLQVSWNHPNLSEPGILWLDVELAADLAGPGVAILAVEYDPAFGSRVESSVYDTPLIVEREVSVRREITLVLFADGFETGDASAWADAVE